jgi:hypothetical protein
MFLYLHILISHETINSYNFMHFCFIWAEGIVSNLHYKRSQHEVTNGVRLTP